jgi:murein DD-endopeptidase MepM/ murein hydrolase activator NlpD
MARERKAAAGCLVRGVLAIALLVLIVAVVGTFWVGSAPEVKVTPGAKGIGRRTPIAVHLDDTGRVLKVHVELVQGQDVTPVADKEFASHPAWAFWKGRAPADFTVEVGRDTVKGLRTGEATVRVTADRAGSWLRRPEPVVTEVKLPVRLAPPTVGPVSVQHYVAQGGCEVVVYRVGESAVKDGVRSGDWWFPGFPMPGPDKQLHFAFYAVPWDTSDASAVRLVAVDDVGNEAAVAFVDQFFPKPIKSDTIPLNDAYLNRVVPEILSQTPEVRDQGDVLKNFLAINGDLRKKEGESLKALAEKSIHQFLWTQPFLPMRNAKITAAFAQRRTYMYQGKQVDQQTHLGFDMASVQRDAVTASNSGTVVLAHFFGIYGNAVVIDHGYGLMSLYGHLSAIAVKEGQHVDRNQELGRSGQTGLAGGDHLHFTMLLGGLPVNPVEWWDPHWIKDRIARKLGPALKYAG